MGREEVTKRAYLGEVMETCCSHCNSRYRISENQLQIATGKVRCGECNTVFNALSSLKTYEGNLPDNYAQYAAMATDTENPKSELSLHEAMYGTDRRRSSQFAPLLWLIGILLLTSLGIAQTIYYQRYQLIDNPKFQQQLLTLCEIVPCGKSDFSSTREIKLDERNVFTHPVVADALMITGSFVNQAPFSQRLPRLLVTLFDIQGNLIANRQFTPAEYLPSDKSRTTMASLQPIQFRLEIVDPGTKALTYEFEFF